MQSTILEPIPRRFSFLNLPAELRIIIYKNVLGPPKSFNSATFHPLHEYLYTFDLPKLSLLALTDDRPADTVDYESLFLVCQQMTLEARAIFFRQNALSINEDQIELLPLPKVFPFATLNISSRFWSNGTTEYASAERRKCRALWYRDDFVISRYRVSWEMHCLFNTLQSYTTGLRQLQASGSNTYCIAPRTLHIELTMPNSFGSYILPTGHIDGVDGFLWVLEDLVAAMEACRIIPQPTLTNHFGDTAMNSGLGLEVIFSVGRYFDLPGHQRMSIGTLRRYMYLWSGYMEDDAQTTCWPDAFPGVFPFEDRSIL